MSHSEFTEYQLILDDIENHGYSILRKEVFDHGYGLRVIAGKGGNQFCFTLRENFYDTQDGEVPKLLGTVDIRDTSYYRDLLASKGPL